MVKTLKLIVLMGFAGLILGAVSMLAAAYMSPAQKNVTGTKFDYLLELEAKTLLSNPRYDMQFIRTSQPDPSYNCHGWTFTGGRRAVLDTEVNRLISGFRYRPVIIPEPEDIVIYYDKENTLCHSGIVKATGANGFVLVESKWGALGRFIHKLDAPQIATSYTFYRKAEMPPMPPRWNPGYRPNHQSSRQPHRPVVTVPVPQGHS